MPKGSTIKSLFALGALIILGWMFYQALDAILILVTGAIIATGIHQGAVRLMRRFGGARKLWLSVIIFTLIGAFAGLGFLAGPQLSSSFNDLQKSVSESWQDVSSTGMIKQTLESSKEGDGPFQAIANPLINLSEELRNILAAAARVVTGSILILAVALFLVWSPQLYIRGFLSLFPKKLRPRLSEVLDKIGESLWFYIIGRGISMLAVGILTGLGLWMIGMKFAIMLGLIAGILAIIPYVGPFLSAIPGILLALAHSPKQALLAALVYVGVQFIEGNFVTPTVMQSEASLPPVLTLISTLALGLVFGTLGFIIATPLTLVALVIYRELYGEMILGETEE